MLRREKPARGHTAPCGISVYFEVRNVFHLSYGDIKTFTVLFTHAKYKDTQISNCTRTSLSLSDTFLLLYSGCFMCSLNKSYASLEAFTTVMFQRELFWVVMPCGVVVAGTMDP
jgi:uncharacterized protein (DUF302 family)